MSAKATSWLARPGLLRTLLSHLRLALRLLREPGVPLLIKAVPVVTGLYLISPFDFVPDLIPVLGQLDDLSIVLIGLETFVKLCPARASAYHRDAIAQGRPYSPMSPAPPTDNVIDAEFRRG
jgi:uncharacterized membrane protein YkvA (DUF1232 family)